MSTFQQTMKSEIIRLARREIKQQTTPIVSGIKKLKAATAALKAELAALQKAKTVAPVGQVPMISDAEVKTARFSGALIKRLRTRHGLSRNEFGKLIGVTGFAVITWETNECKPKADRRKAIIALRKMGKRQVAKLLKEGQAVA
ncbi:MAG: helix-turn-helix transcriptional regulator [bacterium]|nr:helix-turn-helix transcriptional regulator [bacterium]